MDDQPLFDELLHAAERLGVAVRMEPFETPAIMGGGLCVVRGENLVLVDQRAPLFDRIRALVRALVELQSETVYMAPEARELIEALRGDGNLHCLPGGAQVLGRNSCNSSLIEFSAIRARVRYTSPQEDTSHEPRPGKAHAQLVPASEPR